MIWLTISLLLLAATPPDAQAGAASEAPEVQEALGTVMDSSRQLISAKQIEKSVPRYPAAELRRGRQAWVRIAYCIDESGSTQNVSVLDSVGDESFNKAAVRTVEKWKFEPALVDGQPSWQSRNQVVITFAIERGNEGASRRFAALFKKIGKLIDQEKLEEADKLFWRVYETHDLSLYELAKLWAQRVRYEGMSGDIYKLDMALHRATASEGEWIDEKSYIRLLRLRVLVEVQIGQYSAALRGFKELVNAAGDDSDEVTELRPTIEELQAMIDSDNILKINAKVMTKDECNLCNDSWAFTPVRNNFEFTNISGDLRSIEMSCDRKRFESAASDLVAWHIPDYWGTCHVQVYGAPGTTFDILMLPSQSGASSPGT